MKKKKFNKSTADTNDPAANVIRIKLDNAYSVEPSIKDESSEINNNEAHSKHQIYIKKLLASGKSYLDIQADWHSYYLNLPDNEKHDVWREFYALQNTKVNKADTEKHSISPIVTVYGGQESKQDEKSINLKDENKITSKRNLKKKIINKISADGKLNYKHHLRSLLFGIGLATFFALVTGFTLFNQLFIAPFVTPSINASASPIIVPGGVPVSVPPEPKLIIPKLNVEAPIVTDAENNEEATIQRALERGVVLYPNTGYPGELGNQVIFGHSSNNLFNKGSYKYIFALLGKMEKDDIIYVNFESKQYTYKVINKKIIKPTEVSVLAEQPVPALITLITCDPPGANVNRLVIQAEQISPKPDTNKPSTANNSVAVPEVLAGTPESLWRRIINFIF